MPVPGIGPNMLLHVAQSEMFTVSGQNSVPKRVHSFRLLAERLLGFNNPELHLELNHILISESINITVNSYNLPGPSDRFVGIISTGPVIPAPQAVSTPPFP